MQKAKPKKNAAMIESEAHEPGLPDSPPREISVSGPSGYFTPEPVKPKGFLSRLKQLGQRALRKNEDRNR